MNAPQNKSYRIAAPFGADRSFVSLQVPADFIMFG
jgi:hypothetical protein